MCAFGFIIGVGLRFGLGIGFGLRSSRGSILINGSPTKEFQFFRGLKQGDPLSPFLFILVMESLHISFQRVVDAGLFNGINLSSTVNLSHLFYADDAIFIGQWNELNIDTLVRVLECFFRASGLRINMSKSKIMGVNVEDAKVKIAANKLGCLVLKTPFTYLGTKVGENMHRKHAWNEVVEKVLSRLSRWKLKTLSIGGRFTLLKSVLGSMPIFHMSIFKVPSSILNSLEVIRSRFFNGHEHKSNKATWFKWNKVLTSKEKGGLGVSSLFALNRGLLFKWLWRFYSQKDSLWTKVIKALYGEDGSLDKVGASAARTCWTTIVQEVKVIQAQGINIHDFIKLKLGMVRILVLALVNVSSKLTGKLSYYLQKKCEGVILNRTVDSYGGDHENKSRWCLVLTEGYEKVSYGGMWSIWRFNSYAEWRSWIVSTPDSIQTSSYYRMGSITRFVVRLCGIFGIRFYLIRRFGEERRS
ncbi:RNA-directed DNA polymerase, eukaryota, reverse transcriptase zinc-binding domain protein [Tanacetum coccineum]|uniref:RNA-directed DNA polymerase, eukaryota, reverse transcriptase zinc-binding domain protein n=1 Tax=Tanacetum coccineum TaxID=301880 RepID=A0ABQ5EG91_9ASTR